MRPFLQQAAVHYFVSGESDNSFFIFPNRRSISFFKKHLAAAVADSKLNPSGRPLLLPGMLTMNEFFAKLYEGAVADKVTLLLELYECYKELNPKAEALDEFIFWGDVILNDFADIDKYMADAGGVLTNVADFRQLQDDSYLSEAQKAAINQFVSHFRENDGMKLGLNSDDDNVKTRFLCIWNLLYPLYVKFQERLKGKGLAYEGMVYRSVVETLKEKSVADVLRDRLGSAERYVFIGLNVLNECEKSLMTKMRKAGLARFCWDWQSDMIRDKANRSSVFMSENVATFPMDWSLDKVEGVPKFTVISVPSSIGQAKQLPSILRELEGGVGMDTAIVLPDETLLMPLLNSIPPEIRDINVTMGFPMKESSLFSLMNEAAAMQLHLRKKDDEWLFYHRQVWEIFSMRLFCAMLDEDGKKIVSQVKSDRRYYIPQSSFSGNTVLGKLFTPLVTDPKSADSKQIRRIQDWQLGLILALVPGIKNDKDLGFELEFARRYYCAVTLLRDKNLSLMPVSYFRLLERLLSMESLPFSGEPLKGLQIMGPLETRALDFRNLVILSCNEGTFPRHSVSSSFIPSELRKGFGLPTYEHQDAVWAYYFYRSIQRAEKVWLLYDSRTEGVQSGEESRYIKQLQYHFRVPLNRQVASGNITTAAEEAIAKTKYDIDKIMGKEVIGKDGKAVKKRLSASSVQAYLSCPVKFYYSFVQDLKAEEDVEESLDGKMIGNVFHRIMQGLYSSPDYVGTEGSMEKIKDGLKSHPSNMVTREYIDRLLKDKPALRRKVREEILQELNSIEVSGRNLVTENVIVEYVVKTLERDSELLGKKGGSFHMLGLELDCQWEMDGFTFHGFIDRLDEVGGQIRVVDYKTGSVKDDEMEVTEDKISSLVSQLFASCDKNGSRPKILLQLFLYDMFTSKLMEEGKIPKEEVLNSIYKPGRFFFEGVRETVLGETFKTAVTERLSNLLKEMTNPEIPFQRTDDIDRTCKLCDFKKICGR